MSDCRIPMPNYKAPTHSREQDELRIVIHFKDGSLPYPVVMNRLDREVECVTVDGERYERVRECDWKCIKRGTRCSVFHCSKCGYERTNYHSGAEWFEPNYCPNCGAKVVG